MRCPAMSWALPVLLALLAMPATAQEVSEHDYFSDLPVVLSVSRLAQPLNEVPGAVTIIDADTIRRSGAREVAELLSLVPGFLVTRRNGGSTIAAYHAALDVYGARMQVYVDGRSLFSSFYLGDTHRALAALDLADIQRIEVLRGSNSAAFGSNAFLGVVNIVTRAPADTHGISASVTRGDKGIDDNFVRVGWGNEASDMRLSVSRRSGSGFDNLYDDDRRSQLQFRSDFRISPADSFSVKAGVATDAFGEGFPAVACPGPRGTLAGPGVCDENRERTDSWRNGFARFDWVRNLSETSMLKLAGGMDQELYNSSFLARQFPTLFPVMIFARVDSSGTALRQNLEVQRSDVWHSDLRTVFGGEILREEVRAPFLFSTDSSISDGQVRVFGGLEWKPAKDWVINTGGNWERHTMAGKVFAPRLAVNYHLSPEHTLRLVSTKSFHMPSIYMLRSLSNLQVDTTPRLPGFPISSPYTAATGSVRAESVISDELGYLGEIRALGLKVDVRAFRERMDHRMVGLSTMDIVNTPGADFNGIEYQVDWKPFAATRIVFSEAQLHEIPAPNSSIGTMAAPRRSGSLALYQKLPGGFDLSLITHYATPYQWVSNKTLDAMRELDARLAYAFRVGRTRGELAVTAQSLGNSHMEYLPNQIFGRRVFTSLRLDY